MCKPVPFGRLPYGARFAGDRGPCVKIQPVKCRHHAAVLTHANAVDLTTSRGLVFLDGDLVRPLGENGRVG